VRDGKAKDSDRIRAANAIVQTAFKSYEFTYLRQVLAEFEDFKAKVKRFRKGGSFADDRNPADGPESPSAEW
jgi:hypothetical protein